MIYKIVIFVMIFGCPAARCRFSVVFKAALLKSVEAEHLKYCYSRQRLMFIVLSGYGLLHSTSVFISENIIRIVY